MPPFLQGDAVDEHEVFEAGLPVILPFDIPLKFPDEDLQAFPWLREPIRRYRLEKRLQHGGYAIAYVGVPCDMADNPLPGAPRIVVKVPNVGLADRFTTTQRLTRGNYIRDQALTEWRLSRKRLLGCRHANPIFDLGTRWVNRPEPVQLFVSAQLFIEEGLPLDDWLVNARHRVPVAKNAQGELIDNWFGLTGDNWGRISYMIARALAEVHRSRVIHGDIWPPNVFVTQTPEPHAIFIDFGESFIATPSGELRFQVDHPYRAPERGTAEYVPSEQVDVYSLGKLLLYLAIGINLKIPAELTGHRRRAWVREQVFERNRNLACDYPYAVDLIARCTARDPVARPSARAVANEFEEAMLLGHGEQVQVKKAVDSDALNRLERVTAAIRSGEPASNSVFMRFVEQEIAELERLTDTCKTELIELEGTRDRLIRDLQILFGALGPGDSWTAITDPSVWHDGALGLDGRYSTATLEAVRRGASIHRVFVISIEEFGVEFAEILVERMQQQANPGFAKLIRRTRTAIGAYRPFLDQDEYTPPDKSFTERRRERLRLVLASLSYMLSHWKLQDALTGESFSGIRDCKGLFAGLIIVPTLADVQLLRIQNPVSLLYMHGEADPADQWLLIMTDLRDRHERDRGSRGLSDLRGIRIYKSKLGVPNDRILNFDKLFRSDAVNLHGLLEDLIPLLGPVGG